MIIEDLLGRYINIGILMRTKILEELRKNNWHIGFKDKDDFEQYASEGEALAVTIPFDNDQLVDITIYEVEADDDYFNQIRVYDENGVSYDVDYADEYYVVLQFIRLIAYRKTSKQFEKFKTGDVVVMDYDLGTLVFEFDSIKIASEISVYVYRRGLVKPDGKYVPGDGFDYVNYFPEQDKIRKATRREIEIFNKKKEKYERREKEA